jgi:glycine/D-amino acid oxidase-like deaminating enzyme/nitrite reductase/ring-hydroxylating ferredoxin subunit
MIETDRLKSMWGNNPSSHPPLNRNLKTEVCIIGAGLNGLCIAYQLAKKGYKVSILEANQVGGINSQRSTAHLTNLLPHRYKYYCETLGKEKFIKLIESHRSAIEEIEKICEQENINCHFKKVDAFLIQGENFLKKDLREEREYAQLGNLFSELVPQVPWTQSVDCALKINNQAQIDPVKFMSGLLRVLKELDVEIFEETKVTEISNITSALSIITTANNFQLEAKYIVIATHSQVHENQSIHRKQTAYRSYVLGFHVENPPEESILIRDTETPYHYVRIEGNTLIVGGEDHKTGRLPTSSDPFQSLEIWARSRFSFIQEVTYKWSGQVFHAPDGLPFIGKNSEAGENIFIASCFSGNGVTYSMIAAMIISEVINKGVHPWANLYNPERVTFNSAADLVKENALAAVQYLDWITPSEVLNLDEIPEDKGSILRTNFSKVCIYHEREDKFEKKSAVCPHLGGIVHWNDIEKTWDCPCHGSRFNTHGQVIDGPAVKDLMENENGNSI